MALYDRIGKTYTQTRRSDPRIAATLIDILESLEASTVVDIGAGTGSYAWVLAECGYRVLAVEPSAVMRSQAIPHPAIQWIDADAEHLPLPDRAADTAIVMLAFHHLHNPQQALQEIYRVIGSDRIIIFTYDPQMISSFWLTQYFPSFITHVRSTFWPMAQLISELESMTTTSVKILAFPLPHNLSDSFAAVGWGRPELYLDDRIRNGISSFSGLSKRELEEGLSNLSRDLESGDWNQKYGDLRQKAEYDVGYRFVYATPEYRSS